MATPLTTSTVSNSVSEAWPALPLEDWKPTYHNLHMWTQIVGKVRMALAPKTNHWWNVPLYVSARGLTTSPIPYGKDVFEIQFDFICTGLMMRTLRIAFGAFLRRATQFSKSSVRGFWERAVPCTSSGEVSIWR